jgi:hypothetical protein
MEAVITFRPIDLERVCSRCVRACCQKDIANICIRVIYLRVINEGVCVSACGDNNSSEKNRRFKFWQVIQI